MSHTNLLYYLNQTELEAEQGTGGTVTTVRPGVALAHTGKLLRYNKKKTTYNVTVNYKRTNGDVIAESETEETGLVVQGKSAKLKLEAKPISGYAPLEEAVKIEVSGDSTYDFLYKMYTAYTVTINYEFSGETIASSTTAITNTVPEGDYGTVTFEAEEINGYRCVGQSAVTLTISADTEYTFEYEEYVPIEFVDLGLPSGTLWTKYNLGAESEEEFGDFYAWGELTPKDNFLLSNYSLYDANNSAYTKYNESDGLTALTSEDDIVAVTLGNGWHIPSYAQAQELLDNTTSAVTVINGISGTMLTSNINGEQVFFPYGGESSWAEGPIMWSGDTGSIKIRELATAGGIEDTFYLGFGTYSISITAFVPRYAGTMVRGVLGE